jgi:hypothetical protein
LLTPREPTFYFVGVQSSIIKIFPKWADILGIKAAIKGIDLPPHGKVPLISFFAFREDGIIMALSKQKVTENWLLMMYDIINNPKWGNV